MLPKYTTKFTGKAHLYKPSLQEKNEARASLDSLKDLLPSDIDPVNDIDIVYIAGNLAVSSLINLNDDAFTNQDGIAIYKQFERRQCNIEHNRREIVGYIVKSGLSQFGNNQLLTEEQAAAWNEPFNIVTVSALWRVANKGLCDFIIDSSAPGSPNKDSLSLSFEVGFNDFDIVLLPPNETDINKAVRVIQSNEKDFPKYEKLLRIEDGSGKTANGERVGRILRGPIFPLGEGIVTTPAAAVKGVIPITENPSDNQETQSVYNQDIMPVEASTQKVKLPVGLAEKAKTLNYPKVDVTLSDGRVLHDVTVFNGEELELDKSISLDGAVIVSIDTKTPQEPKQVDDLPLIHPNIDKVYPTVTPEAQKKIDEDNIRKHILQNLPYTDALFKHLQAVATLLNIIQSQPGVSPNTAITNQSTMKLEDFKQLEAKVKGATKLEEVTEAFANVALFVEEIMKASESQAKAARESEKAKEDAKSESEAVKKDLEDTKKDLADAKKNLKEIKDAQEAAQAESKFQERMASIADVLDLDDEVRSYIVAEVRAVADDAAFATWLTKAKKLLKGYAKKIEPIGKEKKNAVNKDGKPINDTDNDAKEGVDDDGDEDDACVAAKKALASAKDHPVDKQDLDNIIDTKAGSLSEQYRAAFASGISIGGKKIKDFAKK